MQTLFPIYPPDIKMINSEIGLRILENNVQYFNSGGPIYIHCKDDYQSFRFITSQMIALNTVRQIDIINFFKVSKESVIRWSKIYKKKGPKGFFGTKKYEKRGNVLTDEILVKVQEYLNQGNTPKAIGEILTIKPDTIQKGIQSGRLTRPAITIPITTIEKTQSERSRQDIEATMGVGCTNELGRIEAVLKKK